MSQPLFLRSIAKEEIQKGYNWYEEQQAGVGRSFLREVRTTLASVERSPLLYPRIRGEVRRAVVRRFPYSILYLAEMDRTVVIACFHGRRDPRRWHSRH
ncbi:MAG: type II toxin-antitoxin system RelE/ParE family toxin [Acidobacteriota bacterium]